MQAGTSLSQALEVTVQEDEGPFIQELSLFLRELRMGIDFNGALRHLDESPNGFDFAEADKAYRKTIGDPNWERPPAYTWHHHQDSKPMVLVPSLINTKISHTGGASIIKNKG